MARDRKRAKQRQRQRRAQRQPAGGVPVQRPAAHDAGQRTPTFTLEEKIVFLKTFAFDVRAQDPH